MSVRLNKSNKNDYPVCNVDVITYSSAYKVKTFYMSVTTNYTEKVNDGEYLVQVNYDPYPYRLFMGKGYMVKSIKISRRVNNTDAYFNAYYPKYSLPKDLPKDVVESISEGLHSQYMFFDFLSSKKENKKELNKLKKTSRENLRSTLKSCFYCGSNYDGKVKSKGVCDSHTIPESILLNMETERNKNRVVGTISSLRDNFNYKKVDGTKRLGTFKLICRDCDSKIFKESENMEILENIEDLTPSTVQKVLNQLALKIRLKDYHFYNVDNLYNNSEFKNRMTEINVKTSKLLIDKEISKKGNDKKILYFQVLNYDTGFAVQDSLLPSTIFGDAILNDTTKEQIVYDCYIYTVVYPLGDRSLVLVFLDDDKKSTRYAYKYKKFIDFLDSNPQEDVLRLLSYVLMKNTEKIYFNLDVFESKKWSNKDKMLARSEHIKLSLSDPHNLNILLEDGIDISKLGDVTKMKNYTELEYLSYHGVNEDTVTNLFEVNGNKDAH